MHDVSKIVGAFNYSYRGSSQRSHRIIVWDESGNLYMLTTNRGIDGGYIAVYRIIDIKPYVLGSVFVINYHSSLYGSQRNELLTRIEDIYGMSIEEFSLGQLDYECYQ